MSIYEAYKCKLFLFFINLVLVHGCHILVSENEVDELNAFHYIIAGYSFYASGSSPLF